MSNVVEKYNITHSHCLMTAVPGNSGCHHNPKMDGLLSRKRWAFQVRSRGPKEGMQRLVQATENWCSELHELGRATKALYESQEPGKGLE